MAALPLGQHVLTLQLAIFISYSLSFCMYKTLRFTSSIMVIPFGLVVRIPGSHPGGPGSIPGMGKFFFLAVNFIKWHLFDRQKILQGGHTSTCSISVQNVVFYSFHHVVVRIHRQPGFNSQDEIKICLLNFVTFNIDKTLIKISCQLPRLNRDKFTTLTTILNLP